MNIPLLRESVDQINRRFQLTVSTNDFKAVKIEIL